MFIDTATLRAFNYPTKEGQVAVTHSPVNSRSPRSPREPLSLGPPHSRAVSPPSPGRSGPRRGQGPRRRAAAPGGPAYSTGALGMGAPPWVALRALPRSSLGAWLLTISCLRRRSLFSRRARAAARRRLGAAAGPRAGSAAAAVRPGCSSPRSGRARLSGTLRPSFCSTSRRSGAAPGSMARLGRGGGPRCRTGLALPAAARPLHRRGGAVIRGSAGSGARAARVTCRRHEVPPGATTPRLPPALFCHEKSREGERGEKPPPKLRGRTRPGSAPSAEPRYALAAARPPRAAGSESSRVPAGCNFKARWQVEEARPCPPTVMPGEEARLRRGAPARPTGQPGRRLPAALRYFVLLQGREGSKGSFLRYGKEKRSEMRKEKKRKKKEKNKKEENKKNKEEENKREKEKEEGKGKRNKKEKAK